MSLNPRIDTNDRQYDQADFSAREWWDYWRFYNLYEENWYKQFFPRLVKLSAACLGQNIPDTKQEMHKYATNRMLFIEFCPYASGSLRGFDWNLGNAIAKSELGFQLKRLMRRVIFNFGQPALVLCNGQAATIEVNTQQFHSNQLQHELASIPDVPFSSMELWYGQYEPTKGQGFPVLGFHQLGRYGSFTKTEVELIKRRVHEKNIDIRILE